MLRLPSHPLFGFEAREHTAQVDGEKREVREKRFRYGAKEREQLAADEKHLREIGESEPISASAVLLGRPWNSVSISLRERGVPAQRAANARELRAAQRARRAERTGCARSDVLLLAGPARPVLLPRPEGDGAREVRRRCSISQTATSSRAISRPYGWRAPKSPSIRRSQNSWSSTNLRARCVRL